MKLSNTLLAIASLGLVFLTPASASSRKIDVTQTRKIAAEYGGASYVLPRDQRGMGYCSTLPGYAKAQVILLAVCPVRDDVFVNNGYVDSLRLSGSISPRGNESEIIRNNLLGVIFGYSKAVKGFNDEQANLLASVVDNQLTRMLNGEGKERISEFGYIRKLPLDYKDIQMRIYVSADYITDPSSDWQGLNGYTISLIPY